MIDTHCHIYYDVYSDDINKIIENALSDGIEKMICVGVDLQSSEKCIELSEKYNCTQDQLLLAWILKHPANIYPVLGSTNTNRLKLAVNAIKINLEIDDWFLILKASDGKKVP